MKNKSRDIWDILDLMFKGISSIAIPLAIASLGYFGNQYLQKNQANEAKLRLFTEIMNQREASESDLRKDMFNSIISSFLNPKEEDFEAKVLELELLTYNFHESLNLKPLFIHLRKSILLDLDKANNDLQIHNAAGNLSLGYKFKKRKEQIHGYINRLERVARNITSKQMLYLEKVGKAIDGHVDLAALSDPNIGEQAIYVNDADLTLEEITTNFKIYAMGTDLENKEVRIQLWITSPSSEENEEDYVGMFEFWVGFFDFPAIDNTRLTKNQRCAIILKEFDAKNLGAEITLVYFPGEFASLKEKPYYDELLNQLKGNIETDENPL